MCSRFSKGKEKVTIIFILYQIPITLFQSNNYSEFSVDSHKNSSFARCLIVSAVNSCSIISQKISKASHWADLSFTVFHWFVGQFAQFCPLIYFSFYIFTFTIKPIQSTNYCQTFRHLLKEFKIKMHLTPNLFVSLHFFCYG